MNDNKKSKIWLYAVILFMSAFIILLFTAYSQIKINKNLYEYRSEMDSKEIERQKVQQNFSSAQEMNEELTEEIKSLQQENESMQNEIEILVSDNKTLEETIEEKSESVNGFAAALTSYLEGNVVDSVMLLEKVNVIYLDTETAQAYQTLLEKASAEAGKILFDEGYSQYKKGHYSEAAEKLLLSHEYAPSVSYSDKCLFYLAYAELNKGDKEIARIHMQKLIDNYPSSRFLKSAKSFMSKYK